MTMNIVIYSMPGKEVSGGILIMVLLKTAK